MPGTYTTTVKGQAPALDGTWRIAFTTTGGYSVTKRPLTTKLIVGKATAQGTRLTFHDASGDADMIVSASPPRPIRVCASLG